MNKLSKILLSLSIVFSAFIIAINLLICATLVDYVLNSDVFQGDDIQITTEDDTYTIKSDNGTIILDEDGNVTIDDDSDLDSDSNTDDYNDVYDEDSL